MEVVQPGEQPDADDHVHARCARREVLGEVVVGGRDPCPRRQRDDGEAADQERQAHAHQPLAQEALQPSPLDEHGAEEAAEQEEDGHAEAVDGADDVSVGQVVRRLLVDDRPGVRDKEERRVEDDAEEHRAGAQGVEVVVAGRRLRRRRGGSLGRAGFHRSMVGEKRNRGKRRGRPFRRCGYSAGAVAARRSICSRGGFARMITDAVNA